MNSVTSCGNVCVTLRGPFLLYPNPNSLAISDIKIFSMSFYAYSRSLADYSRSHGKMSGLYNLI